MGDEEEYYFEDDYGDDGGDEGDEEETWETLVENNYAEAKAAVDSSLDDAISKFKTVMADDQDKGKWTFKSLKGIYRACARYRDEARMLEYYAKMLDFQWSGRTRHDIEKAINKFVEKCGAFGIDTQRKTYETTVNAISQDLRNFDKLWFAMKLRLAQLLYQERRFDELEAAIDEMHTWCREGDQAGQRKATQRLNVYALEIQLWTERSDPVKVRNIYTAAMSIKSAIPPPRVLGVLRESGGKLYMKQAQWSASHECFLQAFRSFDEAGDARRIACLKYLVLAAMLSGAEIDPFATNEAKSYQNDPEIVAMTELISACQNNEIQQFERVIRDKKNAQSILDDPFLYEFLEPLIVKVRRQALAINAKPYQCVKLAFLAEQLMVSTEEVEALSVAMILDGQLSAQIDQLAGVLRMTGGAGATGGSRSSAAKGATSSNKAGAKKADAAEESAYDRYALMAQLAQRTAQLQARIVSKSTAAVVV